MHDHDDLDDDGIEYEQGDCLLAKRVLFDHPSSFLTNTGSVL